MGILNITQNSFYDGGAVHKKSEILAQVDKMLAEGATFIDVGAYSSKPHAEFVSGLRNRSHSSNCPINPETLSKCNRIHRYFRAAVAQVALEHGAAMINDISAGSLDEAMFAVIAKHNVPYIMMHMRGTPQTMQSLTTYDDIIKKCCIIFRKKWLKHAV
jgi:dihydropteroate synthase